MRAAHNSPTEHIICVPPSSAELGVSFPGSCEQPGPRTLSDSFGAVIAKAGYPLHCLLPPWARPSRMRQLSVNCRALERHLFSLSRNDTFEVKFSQLPAPREKPIWGRIMAAF